MVRGSAASPAHAHSCTAGSFQGSTISKQGASSSGFRQQQYTKAERCASYDGSSLVMLHSCNLLITCCTRHHTRNIDRTTPLADSHSQKNTALLSLLYVPCVHENITNTLPYYGGKCCQMCKDRSPNLSSLELHHASEVGQTVEASGGCGAYHHNHRAGLRNV